MNTQKSAAQVILDISSLVERSTVVRAMLPPDATPAFVQAVRSGIAARMLVDLHNMTLGEQHPLVEATVEYVSLSMGLLCHFNAVDPDMVSTHANLILEKVQSLAQEHKPSDDTGTPTIVMSAPVSPQ